MQVQAQAHCLSLSIVGDIDDVVRHQHVAGGVDDLIAEPFQQVEARAPVEQLWAAASYADEHHLHLLATSTQVAGQRALFRVGCLRNPLGGRVDRKNTAPSAFDQDARYLVRKLDGVGGNVVFGVDLAI